MQFKYQAYKSGGGAVIGILEGANEQEAINKLGDKDLMIVSLKQVESKNARAKTAKIKIPLTVLTSFTRQLATMIRAGLSLVRCLDSLGRQSKHPGLQTVLQKLSQAVEGGAAFSEALHLHPRVFSTVYIAMVKAGENGGLLAEVLDRMASYLEMSLRLRQRVRAAMMYPMIVSVLGIGICIFMITAIIPVFVDIFKDFQHQLPLPTLILINVSTWVRTNLLICITSAVGTGLLLRYLRRTPMGTQIWDRLKLRVPLFGSLVNKIAFSRFARTLASMLHSGVPVLKAFNIAGTAVSNVELEAAIRKVGDAIEHGATMHDAMVKQKTFPDMMLEMVAAGEETGTVDELLTQVADHYDREIDTTLSGLTSLLEPLLILFLGVVVGAVVIAMFLPIFRMADAVQF
jgi:type IV pilus assembly protein PilC